MRDDGSAIFPEGEEWWLTELEQRKAPEPQLDLAGDNIAEDDLTVNPSEAGSATDDSDTDGGDSTATDEGVPLIPRVRRRLSAYTVSAARKNEHGTAMKGDTVTPEAPRRRLRKKTCIGGHRPSQEEQPDELGELLAGAPGGKLVVSRDSYHDLPPSVRGAFKRGDPRVVVADDEGHRSSERVAAESFALPRCSHQQLKSTSSSSTS